MSSAPQLHKPGSFGERLRREREMRGIKLEEIAESTKIGKRNLMALEEERFDQLPGGIFNKGFVRAYAKFLGLDEEQAVNDFLAASANYDQPAALAPPPTSVVKAPVIPSDASFARRQRLWALTAALVLVAGLALWFDFGKNEFQTLRRRAAQNPSSAVATATNAPAADANRPAQRSAESENSASPAATSENSAAANAPEANAGAASRPVSSAGISASAGSPARSAFARDGVLAEIPATKVTRNPVLDTGNSIELELHATGASWVSALSDGASVLNLELQPGETRRLRADKKLVLRVGNAAALEVTFNGKTLPTLGEENQVRTITFTPAGMQ